MAIVTGLSDQIERIDTAPHPIERDASVVAHNPLGKVPTLLTPEGLVLFDSRVIAEYLDAHSVAAKVFPPEGERRWKALALQALGDGLLDAALLIRYEQTARPDGLRWPLWQERQLDKIVSALDVLESGAGELGQAPDIGTITIACALGYLDLRFPDFAWRKGRQRLSGWFELFARNDFISETAAPTARAA